jgi:2-polyprenyl-6-methoxyphenol hydroxylase-like FAD-dependent oxidoreductase
VFGPDESYVRSLDHIVAATILRKPVVGFRPNDGLVLAEPGRAAWVFPFANHEPAVMLSYRSDDLAAEFQRPPAESLRRAFGPELLGPVLEGLIGQYERAEDTLFDTAEQVQMPSWHDGRVVLLGDAAWCLTLYSGMGVSTGMAGADLLATELQRHPDDLQQGLVAWEAQLRPAVETFQHQARSSGLDLFVPGDRQTLRKRSLMVRLMRAPLIGNILARMRMQSRDVRIGDIDIAVA